MFYLTKLQPHKMMTYKFLAYKIASYKNKNKNEIILFL